MNIFKILASGNGRLNEPNVSAFLGYLLDPKEDHGLGDAFLKRFLTPLFEKDNNDDLSFMSGRDLSIRSNFEFIVLLEQTFKEEVDDGENKIVDIVILCYEKEAQSGQFLAENIIKQKQEKVAKPKHIFLIENKINDSSSEPEQLKKQFQQTINKITKLGIKDAQKLVSVIYVTPDGKSCNKEFEDFEKSKKTNNKLHLYWSKNDDKNTISNIIRDILDNENRPIDAYCNYTLKAFLEFIENDFKSTIKEELEKKREIPYFIYDGKKYSRPKLAEKLISDYIKSNQNMTLDSLVDKFYYKDTIYRPFLKIDDAIKMNSERKAKWYYVENPLKIDDAEICVLNAWKDEDLQELLDRTIGGKLEDLRDKKKDK